MCFHALIASSTKCTSKLAHQSPPSISVIMADWMNQLANAVDEAEAANARAQDEVDTEPATSPRPRMVEILNFEHFVPRFQSSPRFNSRISFQQTMSSQRRRIMQFTRSICQNLQHGYSMRHIGSVYWISR